MKVEKDFRYYGKMRYKVQRILRFLNKGKDDNSLFYMLLCFVLACLCINLEDIFNVDLSYVCGALATIFFMECFWILGTFVTLIVCKKLDKYYWSKRVELFNKYLEEKKDQTCTRNNTNT